MAAGISRSLITGSPLDARVPRHFAEFHCGSRLIASPVGKSVSRRGMIESTQPDPEQVSTAPVFFRALWI